MKRIAALALSIVLLTGCSLGQSASGTLGRIRKIFPHRAETTAAVTEAPPEITIVNETEPPATAEPETETQPASSEAVPEESRYAGPPGGNDNVSIGQGPQESAPAGPGAPEGPSAGPAPQRESTPATEAESRESHVIGRGYGSGNTPSSSKEAQENGSDDVHTGPGAITENTYRRASDTPVAWTSCRIAGENIELQAQVGGQSRGTSGNSDSDYYLFELPIYESGLDGKEPSAVTSSEDGVLSYRVSPNSGTFDSRLYSKFVVAQRIAGRFVAVSPETYITNPEAVASHTQTYEEPLTKKGLLIEFTQVSDAFSLGVHSVILNFPFNQLLGEGIEYFCDGKSYSFDREVVEVYDEIISTFSNKSMNVNLVLLNRWNDGAPDFFEPGMQRTDYADYYNFNVETKRGYELTKAAASFLAERYSGTDPEHGRVQNWIIGNEVNNQRWNYLGACGLEYYTERYERVFRVFYNAIRSTCANDRIFFSVDNNWMHDADGSFRYNSKEFLDSFADTVHKHGNIDWGLAYHPYSVPSTEPEFWDDHQTPLVSWSDDSPVVNFANLSVLTDHMQRPELRDRSGRVRHIILSEQGFTSQSLTRGSCEDLQAAAFAYAYYIVDSNPYIDTFILSRQIDAPSEVKDSLALGLWTTSSTEDVNILPARKKKIWSVFRNIDRQKYTLESTEFAKSILGIGKWSDIIPDFRWKRLENE